LNPVRNGARADKVDVTSAYTLRAAHKRTFQHFAFGPQADILDPLNRVASVDDLAKHVRALSL